MEQPIESGPTKQSAQPSPPSTADKVASAVLLAMVLLLGSVIAGYLIPSFGAALRSRPMSGTAIIVMFTFILSLLFFFAMVGNFASLLANRKARKPLYIALVLVLAVCLGLFNYSYRESQQEVQRLVASGASSEPQPSGPLFSRGQLAVIGILLALLIPSYFRRKDDAPKKDHDSNTKT
jgi:MFS family permease